MRLTIRPLIDVATVNNFDYTVLFEMTEGDTVDLYFMLVDQNAPEKRRYMPAVGATLMATVDHIDDAKKITRACVQPFAQDASIWKLSLLATDVVRGTCNLKLALTEGLVTTSCLVANVIRSSVPSCI